ncbi:MAG: M23 family metallopeptidase, partial [Candidatus Celaenobacter polaris]|nr:M23 family metallopeptidase [Candidatus Celaenobacter polaris]
TKVEISRLSISGYNHNKELICLNIYAEEIEDTIKQVVPQINKLINTEKSFDYLTMTFGKTKKFKDDFADSNILEPKETTLMPLSLMRFVHYIGITTLENLCMCAFINSGSNQEVIEFPIELYFSKVTQNFIFPLRGKLCVCNLPMNIPQHRKAKFQEFALDIVGYEFSTSRRSKPLELSDYSIFRKDVISIGDGTIVEIGDEFPDSEISKPKSYSEEYFNEISKRLLPNIGMKNTMLGNYILIDHNNEQYSLYAHLSENSITVKKGDRIKQGDLIAKVGNTGHSTEPHLHFQLIDSKNIFEANGLPIIFENLPIAEMNQNFSDSNSLIHSDYFHAYID